VYAGWTPRWVDGITPYIFDIIINITREYDDRGQEVYIGRIEKCRARRLKGAKFQDITMPKLLDFLETKMGLKFPEWRRDDSRSD